MRWCNIQNGDNGTEISLSRQTSYERLDDGHRRPAHVSTSVVEISRDDYWGEPERAPHDQSNGDRVCLSVCLSVCVCVHRTFTFRIYARSNLTQMCNISLVQSDSTSRVQVHSQYSTAR